VITDAELGEPARPLLGAGLPVIDVAPVALPDVSSAEMDSEGPLALDYRAWGKQVESPRMAVPHDVTYGETKKTKVNYDGKSYYYPVHTVTDK
jgi:hypothetical protein